MGHVTLWTLRIRDNKLSTLSEHAAIVIQCYSTLYLNWTHYSVIHTVMALYLKWTCYSVIHTVVALYLKWTCYIVVYLKLMH